MTCTVLAGKPPTRWRLLRAMPRFERRNRSGWRATYCHRFFGQSTPASGVRAPAGVNGFHGVNTGAQGAGYPAVARIWTDGLTRCLSLWSTWVKSAQPPICARVGAACSGSQTAVVPACVSRPGSHYSRH